MNHQIFCVMQMVIKHASARNSFAMTHGNVRMAKTRNIVFMMELTNIVMESNGSVKTKKNASIKLRFVLEKMIVLTEAMKCSWNVVSL